jgi:hypothetical protein
MQKAEIDYSNTLFYKIFCKDVSITDLYVGHTTNFVQRKSAHKQSCKNLKSQLKLYNFIREHGGWTNWQMDIIAHHHCKDHYEARTKEQEYFISYNATLNSVEPMPRPKCEKQLIVPSNDTSRVYENSGYAAPEAVIQLSQESYISTPSTSSLCKNINANKLYCEKCQFGCNKQSDYARHISTAKHQRKHQITDNCSKSYTCVCGNTYKHSSGLYRHKPNCNFIQSSLANNNVKQTTTQPLHQLVDASLVIEVLKQNHEFKELMMEQNKHMIEQNKHMMELIKTQAS